MKKRIIIIISIAILIAAMLVSCDSVENETETETGSNTESETQSEEESSADIVDKADDFTVFDYDMNEVKLSDKFGKPIVINFWATWCGPCISELPAFDSMHEKYGDDIVFLMVNLTDGMRDTVSGVKNFVLKSGYSFPVYFDTTFSAVEAYDVNSIPKTVFIKSDGSVYNTQIGSMSEGILEYYIKQLIGD